MRSLTAKRASFRICCTLLTNSRASPSRRSSGVIVGSSAANKPVLLLDEQAPRRAPHDRHVVAVAADATRHRPSRHRLATLERAAAARCRAPRRPSPPAASACRTSCPALGSSPSPPASPARLPLSANSTCLTLSSLASNGSKSASSPAAEIWHDTHQPGKRLAHLDPLLLPRGAPELGERRGPRLIARSSAVVRPRVVPARDETARGARSRP